MWALAMLGLAALLQPASAKAPVCVQSVSFTVVGSMFYLSCMNREVGVSFRGTSANVKCKSFYAICDEMSEKCSSLIDAACASGPQVRRAEVLLRV